MNAKNGRSKGILRESLAIVLVLALLAPALGAKERRGATLVITKTDGKVVEGELLGVKGHDVTLLDISTSAELTESLVNIQLIDKIPKKSKWVTGMILGVIAGGVIGALAEKANSKQDPYAGDQWRKGHLAVAAVVGDGLLGAAIGHSIKEKTIKIERTDQDYLVEIAAKLNKWARNPR